MRPKSRKLLQHGSALYSKLLEPLGSLIFGRWSLILAALVILVIASNVLQHLYAGVFSPADDVDEMLREVEGISTLFLAIGLILKERYQLEKIFFRKASLDSSWLNNLCLTVGLSLILNGTAMRVTVQLVKIPDHVLNTQGMEQLLFCIGLLFCSIASLLLVYLIVRIFQRRTIGASEA